MVREQRPRRHQALGNPGVPGLLASIPWGRIIPLSRQKVRPETCLVMGFMHPGPVFPAGFLPMLDCEWRGGGISSGASQPELDLNGGRCKPPREVFCLLREGKSELLLTLCPFPLPALPLPHSLGCGCWAGRRNRCSPEMDRYTPSTKGDGIGPSGEGAGELLAGTESRKGPCSHAMGPFPGRAHFSGFSWPPTWGSTMVK